MQIVKLIDPKTLNRFLCCQQGYKPVMVDGHLILNVKLPVVDTMDSSLNDTGLQGIMVDVVIKTNIQSKMMLNTTQFPAGLSHKGNWPFIHKAGWFVKGAKNKDM